MKKRGQWLQDLVAERGATSAKPRPEHYKIVTLSMYTRDVDSLDAKVLELKQRGCTRMNRSRLVRIALRQLSIDNVTGGES